MTRGGGTEVADESLLAVVVLGMHRSGTSLITRLVSLAGPAMCRPDDLVVGGTRNPRGHWESDSLVRFDDRLLHEVGASWYCPPTFAADDPELERLVDTHAVAARETLLAAHPIRPFVWKDPRISILLAFWRRVMPGRVAYVVATRHPLEVCASLTGRNGFSVPFGLALWERYTRESFLGAAGSPALLCTYDEVLHDPGAWCDRLVGFLRGLGVDAEVDPVAVDGFIASGLRHSSRAWSELADAPELSGEQRRLAEIATEAVAADSWSPSGLSAETPETEAMFARLRAAGPGVPELSALPAEFASPVARTAPRRARGPAASLVVWGPAAEPASRRRIADGLPPGSETETAAASGVVELAALAAAARGAVVVLATAGVDALDEGWFEAVAEALERQHVAGAGPRLSVASEPAGVAPARGLRFDGPGLQLTACREPFRRGIVPLLNDALCVVTREVLETSGGLDPAFDSPAGAIAELGVRLWRMGFRCDGDAAGAGRLAPGPGAPELRAHDRLRIASLHFGEPRRAALERRLRGEPGYDDAVARLAAGDVASRRTAIGAVCPFAGDGFFDDFPVDPPSVAQRSRRLARTLAVPVARALGRRGAG